MKKVVHLFLLFIFFVVGIAGLILRVDEGVFIGLTLFPFQLRLVLALFGKQKTKLITSLITIAFFVGVIYFILIGRWVPALAMAVVQGYIYKVVTKPRPEKNEESESDKK